MSEKSNLVLVDDDPNTLQMYTLLLSKQDIYTHKFLSAIDALSFLRFTDKPIDLIITDLNMPGMDGLKFISQVRAIPAHLTTPFVFLTAVDDQNFMLEAYKFGAIDYIQKPVDNGLFIAKVKSLITSYRLNALKHNILLKGNHNIFSIEEIIQYCEQEQLSGYALISDVQDEGLLIFEKGVLKEISSEGLKETQAFEKMGLWKEFRFLIARGKFNPVAIQFLQN